MRNVFCMLLTGLLLSCGANQPEKIDRQALVARNSPKVTAFDKHASLSLGNGNFAFTADATGLQTFPDIYASGVPLCTQSQWGWHSFPNRENYQPEEALKNYNFRGREEPYAVQFNEPGRAQEAANYYLVNPHRLHLGYVGLELTDDNGKPMDAEQISGISQELNLWNGILHSRFMVDNDSASVTTAVHPEKDLLQQTTILSDR